MDVAALIISLFALIAAGVAAAYTAVMASVAKKQLAADTEPYLRITVTDIGSLPGYDYARDGTSTQPVWFLENRGRAVALQVNIQLEFDPDGIHYGLRMIEEVGPEEKVRIDSKKPLPAFHELITSKPGHPIQTAKLRWKNANGEFRTKTIHIGV